MKSIRHHCEHQNVAFFFKQWGGFQKKRAGRALDGRTYDGMPPVIAKAPPKEDERLLRVREVEPLVRRFSAPALEPGLVRLAPA